MSIPDPVGDVVRAFTVPGPRPDAHRAAVSHLRQDWPTLADALARLVIATNTAVMTTGPWPEPPTPGTIRDLIHYTPATRCSVWSDECPDWLLADRLWRTWREDGPEAMIGALLAACAEPDERPARPDPMKPHRRPWNWMPPHGPRRRRRWWTRSRASR